MWIELLKALGPVLLAQIPGIVQAVIPLIVHSIAVQQQTGASGSEKKAAVMAHVEDGAAVPIDPALLSRTIDHVVATVNRACATQPVQP